MQTSNLTEAERLLHLSSDIQRVAQRIVGRAEARPKPSKAERVTFIGALYRAKAKRVAIFSDVNFAEPGWHMLLDLYLADADQKPVATSSLCYASGVPATTALRWIGTLVEAGYVVRSPDPNDGRRMLIRLSEEGRTAIDAWIDEAAAVGLV